MRRWLALCLLVAAVSPAAGAAEAGPRLVGVYPNPALPGDRGEFVVLEFPAGYAANLTVSDGESELALVAPYPAGRVAVTADPAVRNLTDLPVLVVPGRLRLANGGEGVTLRAGGRVLDAVTYPPAPEGALYERAADGWRWRRLGATSFPVRRARGVAATLFVLPDAPGAALAPIRAASDRVWLAAYTLTSRRVVRALCDARARGADVRVLAERAPVGGLTAAAAARFDRLAACGVGVRLLGGPRGRYAFHHAKYVVADGRAVVLTENWKPSGVGGRSSRGWGVVVEDHAVTAALAATFAADVGWRDSEPWAEARGSVPVVPGDSPADGRFPAAVTPSTVDGLEVEVLLAPDNAERRVVGVIDGADESMRVIQVSVGGPGQPFVRALVRAARRGVEVRLLLAGVWYVREDNRAVADALNRLARAEDLPLSVRLAAPRGRFGKVHAKGAVVDGERVLVGSLNWNNASARRNREVALLLHGREAGAYYASVFDADWRGGRWRVPVGLPAFAALLGLVVAVFAARSIEFESPDDAAVEPGPTEVEVRDPY